MAALAGEFRRCFVIALMLVAAMYVLDMMRALLVEILTAAGWGQWVPPGAFLLMVLAMFVLVWEVRNRDDRH